MERRDNDNEEEEEDDDVVNSGLDKGANAKEEGIVTIHNSAAVTRSNEEEGAAAEVFRIMIVILKGNCEY
jgi:hypothetical protein